ncbi:MAG: flagellar biosynthesis protein FlhB [Gammaproteobacteria bacterium]
MAEETGQERTQEATPRRKEQAREKGQTANSRELNTVMMLMISGAALFFLGPYTAGKMQALFKEALDIDRQTIFTPMAMPALLQAAVLDAMSALTPFFIVVVIAALAGPLSMAGFNFSTQALAFKWEKLDPIKGLKRIFAVRGLVELLKALAKFVIIASVAIVFLYHQAGAYLGLGSEPLEQAIGHAGQLLIWGFVVMGSTMILIALVDVPFQLWDHHKQLRMTFQEVKDENKDTEGNPEVRGRVRQMQRDIAQRRMMQEVPKADVIITNPEHYSVALRYEGEKMGAPILIAKGVDLIAFQIRNIALEHNVPIVQAPPLARALFHTTELNKEIPAGLYLAVAQVLAYVYQLRQRTAYGAAKQHKMNDLPIPDDLQFD